jgi:hypothetical protein
MKVIERRKNDAESLFISPAISFIYNEVIRAASYAPLDSRHKTKGRSANGKKHKAQSKKPSPVINSKQKSSVQPETELVNKNET